MGHPWPIRTFANILLAHHLLSATSLRIFSRFFVIAAQVKHFHSLSWCGSRAWKLRRDAATDATPTFPASWRRLLRPALNLPECLALSPIKYRARNDKIRNQDFILLCNNKVTTARTHNHTWKSLTSNYIYVKTYLPGNTGRHVFSPRSDFQGVP